MEKYHTKWRSTKDMNHLLVATWCTVLFPVLVFSGVVTTAATTTKQVAMTTSTCVKEIIALNASDSLKSLQHFNDWTDEEVPCFTRCIVNEQGFYNLSTDQWNEENIISKIGKPSFNYCDYELIRKHDNACESAHRGFRCMQKAEKKIRETFGHYFTCSADLNATLQQQADYHKFNDHETIPCFFQCLADRMNFYTSSGDWIFANWENAFGAVEKSDDDLKDCKVSPERRLTEKKCQWMFEEYICVKNLIVGNQTRSTTPFESTTIATIIVTSSTIATLTTTDDTSISNSTTATSPSNSTIHISPIQTTTNTIQKPVESNKTTPEPAGNNTIE